MKSKLTTSRSYQIFWRFLRSILIPVLISACSVGPDYQAPEMSLPESWVFVEEEESLSLATYWKLFDDPVLHQLFDGIVRDNLQLRDAALRIAEAEVALSIQRATFGPDVDFTATVQGRRRSEAVASAISNPKNDLISVGGLINWELDIFGRIRRATEFQVASLEATREDYFGVMVSLHAELARNYIQYRTLEHQIVLTKKNIKLQRESYTLAKQRFEAGLVPELDVHQAESNLHQTESQLPLLRLQLKQRLHVLAVLLGEYPEETKSRIPGRNEPLSVPQFPAESLPLNVLRQRPDVKRAERQLAAQHALIGVAEGALYPVLSLPGAISFQALDTLEDAFLKGSLAYSFGPRVDLNLFDFGRVRGEIKIQEFRTKQLEARYRQQVLQAVREVEDALVLLREQKIRSGLLSKSVAASRQSARDVRTLYVNGVTDFQNVLDSERRLFEQEISLAETEGNAVEACVLLFRSLGGGWYQQEAEEVKEIEKSSEAS